MSELTTVLGTVSLILYAVICFLLYKRAKDNPKRYVMFVAFLILFIYMGLNMLGKFGVDIGTKMPRHLIKTMGYAVLLGSFSYLLLSLKDPRQLLKLSIASSLVALVAILFDAFVMLGMGFHPIVVGAVLLSLVLLGIAYFKLSDIKRVIATFVSGTILLLASYITAGLSHEVELLHVSELIALVAGIVVLAASALIFYKSFK